MSEVNSRWDNYIHGPLYAQPGQIGSLVAFSPLGYSPFVGPEALSSNRTDADDWLPPPFAADFMANPACQSGIAGAWEKAGALTVVEPSPIPLPKALQGYCRYVVVLDRKVCR